MAREPRANAAFLRLPRSGNHHDLGLFGVGASRRARAAASGSTTWPGRSTPSRSSSRPGSPWPTSTPTPASPATARPRASTPSDPDGNEFEVMWMLPKASWGEFAERGAGRPARPGRRGPPVGRRPHRGRAGPGGGAMTTATFAPPVVATYGSHGPVRTPGRPAARARLQRARDPRPGGPPAERAGVRGGARADRRGRWVRLVRQPRHRSPGRRVAARHHGLVPHLARRRRPGRPTGAAGRLQRRGRLRRRPGAGRPGTVRRGGDPLRDPAVRRRTRHRRRPTGPPAGVRGPGRRRPRHPPRAPRPDLGLPAGRVRRAHGRAAAARRPPADRGDGPRARRLDRPPARLRRAPTPRPRPAAAAASSGRPSRAACSPSARAPGPT